MSEGQPTELFLHKCLKCGYSLDGLPVVHQCPECGLAFDRRWKVFGPRFSGTGKLSRAGRAFNILQGVLWIGLGIAAWRDGWIRACAAIIVTLGIIELLADPRFILLRRHWIAISPSGLKLFRHNMLIHEWSWVSFDFAQMRVPIGGFELIRAETGEALDGPFERRLRSLGDQSAVVAVNTYPYRNSGSAGTA